MVSNNIASRSFCVRAASTPAVGVPLCVRNPRSLDQRIGVDDVVGLLGDSIDVDLFIFGQGEGPGESC